MDTATPHARPTLKPMAALAALALTPLLAACAVAEARTSDAPKSVSLETPEESARQCFFARQVTGFRNARDEDGERVDTHLLVDVGASDTYEFELLRRCPGLRFARGIRFVQTGPGRICDGLDVDIIVPDGGIADRCHVTMVRKIERGEDGSRLPAQD
ncbi:DUF6491 family protein [uncultured Erythrobacter sp.]|uniref:DUF6491 family protein n=1 Tax=uncultured Erythrobacter sp. TaxID=263913 RepID=UPI002627AB2C|nr:DUF6491 family protein [uncultured Erythrobacter sp.]